MAGMLTAGMVAQNALHVYKKDGSIVDYTVAELDSIVFEKPGTVIAETPTLTKSGTGASSQTRNGRQCYHGVQLQLDQRNQCNGDRSANWGERDHQHCQQQRDHSRDTDNSRHLQLHHQHGKQRRHPGNCQRHHNRHQLNRKA